MGPRTAVIVLAAGGGSRFAASGGDSHKLLAPYFGRTLVEWALDHALAADLDATYAVVGATDIPAPEGVEIVHNQRWQEGIATSLRAGLAAAKRDGHHAAVVGLGDQPLVSPQAWRNVAASPGMIAVATYKGVRGNPVRLDSRVWPLLPKTGDEGARAMMRRRPDLVVEVPCPGCAADIDTVEDLAEWS